MLGGRATPEPPQSIVRSLIIVVMQFSESDSLAIFGYLCSQVSPPKLEHKNQRKLWPFPNPLLKFILAGKQLTGFPTMASFSLTTYSVLELNVE